MFVGYELAQGPLGHALRIPGPTILFATETLQNVILFPNLVIIAAEAESEQHSIVSNL